MSQIQYHPHIGSDCFIPSYQKELSFDPYRFASN